MATRARHFCMRARKREFCFAVVEAGEHLLIQLWSLPRFGRMALTAIGAELVELGLGFGVAINTVFRGKFVLLRRVAFGAGQTFMFSSQRKLGAAMIELPEICQ